LRYAVIYGVYGTSRHQAELSVPTMQSKCLAQELAKEAADQQQQQQQQQEQEQEQQREQQEQEQQQQQQEQEQEQQREDHEWGDEGSPHHSYNRDMEMSDDGVDEPFSPAPPASTPETDALDGVHQYLVGLAAPQTTFVERCAEDDDKAGRPSLGNEPMV